MNNLLSVSKKAVMPSPVLLEFWLDPEGKGNGADPVGLKVGPKVPATVPLGKG